MIVNHYAINHENMHVISQSNQGLSRARNVGIENAKGLYVWFVDSDDWIERGFLCKVLTLLKNCDQDILTFRIKEYDEESGKLIKERDSYDNDNLTFFKGYEVLSNYHKNKNLDPTPIQMHIIKKSFILSNNLFFEPNIYHEDKDYAPRIFINASNICYVPWFSYCYLRRKTGSITSSKELFSKRAISIGLFLEKHIELEKKLPSSKLKKTMMISNHDTASFFWAIATRAECEDWYDRFNMQKYIPILRRYILKIIWYDKKITLGQIAFLLFPKLAFNRQVKI